MSAALKLTLFSAVGVFAFFVPIQGAGRSTIVIDHIVTFVTSRAPSLSLTYALVMIVWGTAIPFMAKTRARSTTGRVLSYLQLIAIPLAFMHITGIGPAFITAPDMLPFLFEKLAVPVGLIVPVGAVFLTFMIGFGLLQACGILMEPVMRPIFRTPGLSAVDAVASFVGSYSIALLITGRVFKSGMYSAREAAIIASGFSTVSTAFMLTVAKTLGLIEVWIPYFFGTMFVTFIVTAVTARLPPLTRMDNTHSRSQVENATGVSRFRTALTTGLSIAASTPPLHVMLVSDLRDGLSMAARILPSILSLGLLGLLAAKYTPLFDVIGLLFSPVVWMFFPDNSLEVSSIIASGLAEMFLPSLQAVSLGHDVRFVVAVVSVSSVLFLSGSIPCIFAAGIPMTMPQLISIWFIRTVLSIPCAVGVYHLLVVLP